MKNMTELVKKYQDEAQFPRMIGSQGGMDYLILAKNPENGLQLGLKVLFGIGQQGDKKATFISFRLRSARIPDWKSTAEVVGISKEHQPDAPEAKQPADPHEGWDFPWEQVGNSHTGPRASLIRTMILARSPEEAGWVFDDLDHVRFFGKLQAFLHEKVPDEQFVVTDDDIADYFRASLYPILLDLEATYTNNPVKQLEVLELQWETQVKNHDQHQKQYEEAKAKLLEKIAALENGEPEAYHPKAHFGDEELVAPDNIGHVMLSGAKPKLTSVETGEEPTFETAEEPTGEPGPASEEPGSEPEGGQAA